MISFFSATSETFVHYLQYAYCIGIHAQFYTLHMNRQENRVGDGKRVDSISMSQEMQVALNNVSPADFQCDLRYM